MLREEGISSWANGVNTKVGVGSVMATSGWEEMLPLEMVPLEVKALK
jgi:hypothetical protein